MLTFIVERKVVEVEMDYAALGYPGDPWPPDRPVTVTQELYGKDAMMEIYTHYPDGAVPVAELEIGGTFRVTVERITEE